MQTTLAFVALALVAMLPSSPRAAEASFPAGFVPTEIRRWLRDDTQWDHTTAPPGMFGNPWRNEGSLGWLSTRSFPGSHALYVCKRLKQPFDHFTSAYEHCEGQTRVESPYILGYVSSAPIAGTVPLHRCVSAKNEFDSLDPNCEGHTMVGVLGWVFP